MPRAPNGRVSGRSDEARSSAAGNCVTRVSSRGLFRIGTLLRPDPEQVQQSAAMSRYVFMVGRLQAWRHSQLRYISLCRFPRQIFAYRTGMFLAPDTRTQRRCQIDFDHGRANVCARFKLELVGGGANGVW